MADPYNPYTSYSTPTPGGVGYYPPDDQSGQQAARAYPYHQPPYDNVMCGGAAPPPDPNYTYAPQPSPYHVAPEGYQNNASERSYTPVGQPDYLEPVSGPGMPQGGGKVPENLGYYGSHPANEPRYTPSHSSRPPSVYVSEADNAQSHDRERRGSDQGEDPESSRGMGSSLAGGAAGYYFGHKKDHGLLGAIGGAIIGNFLEDKVKKHERSSSPSSTHGTHHGSHHESHGSHHGSHLGVSHHGHHHHHHHHRHSRSRSHSRHRGEDD